MGGLCSNDDVRDDGAVDEPEVARTARSVHLRDEVLKRGAAVMGRIVKDADETS